MNLSTLTRRDKKAFEKLEKTLTSDKEVNPKAIEAIEEQFALYSYLKSLIEMRKQEIS